MDFRSSFRSQSSHKNPQGMFKTLRRLHGQNLESRGLNDMTEAFQNFVTRARFFSVGKLRRTWSHSAVEFMKYRRLLPMLLADGQDFDNLETDDFDAAIAFQASSKDDRKIVVTNISPKITQSQLQSFFSQFGKITSCSLPKDEKTRQSIFATLPKHTANCGTATITFKKSEDATKAKTATAEQLKFYDQTMIVTEFVSRRKGGRGMTLSDDRNSFCEDNLSRASSSQSLASTGGSCSLEGCPFRALERIFSFLPVADTVRLERVNKKWMEASVKSWYLVHELALSRECNGPHGFGKHKPIRNSHLKAILRRAGCHLKSLDLSGIVHLVDDKSLKIIAECCPNLTDLDLSGIRANSESLSDLSESLTKLKRIAYRDMICANDKAFWHLVKGSVNSLQFVDFRGCRKFHGRCTKLFSNNLEQLYLDGCSKVDDIAFEDLCTQAPGLKELRINECYQITDQNLSMISRHMEELQVLTLCGDQFEHLTISGLLHISHMKNLTELALDFNPLVSDAVVKAVVKGLPELKILSVANSGSDQSLSMHGMRTIGELKHLEQLDLSSLAAVRSPVLIEVAYGCKNLSLFQLRNCTYLADDGVSSLKNCAQLSHVDLSGSILITSESISDLIKAFPQNKDQTGKKVTVVVGGCAVDASKLSVRGSRVQVDFSDYSQILALPSSTNTSIHKGSRSDDEGSPSDDEFDALTAQRSFYIDSVCGEDDSPIENEKEMQEWAEREARQLGLIGK